MLIVYVLSLGFPLCRGREFVSLVHSSALTDRMWQVLATELPSGHGDVGKNRHQGAELVDRTNRGGLLWNIWPKVLVGYQLTFGAGVSLEVRVQGQRDGNLEVTCGGQ